MRYYIDKIDYSLPRAAYFAAKSVNFVKLRPELHNLLLAGSMTSRAMALRHFGLPPLWSFPPSRRSASRPS
jgi:hypothetical protein